MLCERCKKDVYKHMLCKYCNRKICNACMKSSKKVTKINRIAICKDCWGKTKIRKEYKNEIATPPQEAAYERSYERK